MHTEKLPDIRRPLYQGSQLVAALWFDCALLGEDTARARLLGGWEAGARAYRVRDGYLLEWPAARRLHCAGLPGLPLCREGGLLTSAPLHGQERAVLPAVGAVLVLGASLQVHDLGPATRIDPSRWLDVSAIAWAKPLSMPRDPAAGFVNRIAPPPGTVRAALGDAVPPPSRERDAFLRQAASGRGRASGAAGLLGAAMSGVGLAGAGVARLLASLRRGSGAGKGTGPAASGRTPPTPSGSWLRERLAQLAMFTKVSHALGWRQARYLQAMLREFEDGNLEEALRRAIPLDAQGQPGPMAFGTPSRRDRLDISGAGGTASSIGLEPDAIALLRQTYQRSFEMLDRAGRIDQAVFVLAELLNRPQEAVDYLERHGRLARAAQLAETLQLAPAAIVRLHCMAGNAERAVLLARLMNAFGEAVAELERRQHPAAALLRLEWAEDLAARGQVVQAAATIWPLHEERGRALAWLHAARNAGGALGAEGVLYALALDADSHADHDAAVEALLFGEGEEAAQQRSLAVDCLLKLAAPNPILRRIAAALWRAGLADHAAGHAFIASDALARLQTFSNDRLLGADMAKGRPPLRDAVPLANRSSPVTVRLPERGLLPIEDVCVLPDGGVLLALGEQGAALARADGTVRMRFPMPAQHLVLAEGGHAALLLARREKTVRIGRLDLVTRKMSDWFSAPLRFWAREYDGASWSVVVDNRLLVLDTAADRQSVLWQVDPGQIIGLDRQQNMEAVLIAASERKLEQWRYALPARRLLAREQFDTPNMKVQANAAASYPLMHDVVAHADGSASTLFLHAPYASGSRQLTLPGDAADVTVSALGDQLLVAFTSLQAWHCRLHNPGGRIQAEILLPGARGAQAGMRGGYLCAWDQHGRLVTINAATGAVRALTLS